MKKLLLVGTALTVLFGGSALAADLRRPAYTPPPPPPPVFSWTGFYIGGNLGGAWARGTVSDSLFGLSASSDRSGFIGGGQLGVNYPATSFLAPSGTLTGHRSTRLGMAVLFPASELSRD